MDRDTLMPLPLTGIILAGGQSRRMGRDKALLPFNGYASLTEYQFARLNPLFEALFISTKAAKFSFEAPIITDNDTRYAPIIALKTLFSKLTDDRLFLLSVDTPFVDFPVIKRLFDALEQQDDAVIARSPGQTHPLCAIYRKSVLPAVEAMVASNDYKLQRLLDRVYTRFIDFEEEVPFYNMNRPDEYRKAQTLLQETERSPFSQNYRSRV